MIDTSHDKDIFINDGLAGVVWEVYDAYQTKHEMWTDVHPRMDPCPSIANKACPLCDRLLGNPLFYYEEVYPLVTEIAAEPLFIIEKVDTDDFDPDDYADK